MSKRRLFLYFLTFLSITFVFYGRTLFTWFQQDEWSVLGMYKYYLSQPNGLAQIFFYNLLAKPRFSSAPLSTTLFALLSHYFGLNFYPYALVSLMLRSANAFLVYILMINLTRSNRLSFLTGFFFAISGIGQKSIIWVLSSVNVQGATLFSLLCLIQLFKYLNQTKKGNLYLYLLFLLMATWFKETALSVLVVIYGYLITSKLTLKKWGKKERRVILITTIFIITVVVSRVITSFIGKDFDFNYLPPSRLLSTKEFLGFVITILPQSVVDVFLLPNTLYQLGKIAVYLGWPQMRIFWGTTQFDQLSETSGVSLINIVLFPLILFFIFRILFFLKKSRKENFLLLKTGIIGFFFILSSATIGLMLTVRGTNGITYIARSRDLYIATIGPAILLAILCHLGLKKHRKRLVFLAITAYSLYNFTYIQSKALNPEIVKASLRTPIIKQIYNFFPTIPQKVVFFTQSDTPYYGATIPSMPYQTGFGRTLLMWYIYQNKKIPPDFGKDDFLYLPNSEGYKEINGYGFGYFTDFTKLKEAVEEHGLDKESVIAFSFSGKTRVLIDISNIIRGKL